jgi:hypothetical protein
MVARTPIDLYNSQMELIPIFLALHELDPAFRRVTLENERLRMLVRDLKFHKDPVGQFQPELSDPLCLI